MLTGEKVTVEKWTASPGDRASLAHAPSLTDLGARYAQMSSPLRENRKLSASRELRRIRPTQPLKITRGLAHQVT
jgi:hypothetical protein